MFFSQIKHCCPRADYDRTCKKLGDGIGSLKKGQQPAAPAPEPGKKDRSFLVVAGGAIVLMEILYFIKLL